MNKVLGGLSLLTILVISSLAVPSRAATNQPVKKAVQGPSYDARKEITLSGTVSSVKNSVPGKLMGGHLFLSSGTGTVDAHLGPFALRGRESVKLTSGEQVKLVGVMSTFHGSQVFLVRTVEAGGHTYNIRNEKGFPQLMGAVQPTHTLSLAKGGSR